MNSFKKMRLWLGWCPNVSAIEPRKSVQFDDIMVNAPGSGGELTHTTARWWNVHLVLYILHQSTSGNFSFSDNLKTSTKFRNSPSIFLNFL